MILNVACLYLTCSTKTSDNKKRMYLCIHFISGMIIMSSYNPGVQVIVEVIVDVITLAEGHGFGSKQIDSSLEIIDSGTLLDALVMRKKFLSGKDPCVPLDYSMLLSFHTCILLFFHYNIVW